MRALHFDGSELRLAERPEPDPLPDCVLVRVSLAGVCNTDLEIAKGYLGFRGILGHEFVGRVSEGPEEWLGARVVAEINFACRSCPACARGLERHCPSRTVMGIAGADGAFAELVRVPVRNLHAVPDAVPDEMAVFCEPLAAAFEILEQVHVEAGQRAVVLGDGKLGLLAAQVLALAGARVLAVGRHPEKLALLRARGIETALAQEWRPDPAPLVIEATGSERGFQMAVAATLPRGTLVLKSTLASHPAVDLAPLVIHELQVVGSRCGPFPPALRALESGTVDVTPLISDRVPLAAGADALRRAARPGALKVLIEPAGRGATT
jgi:threonine dehydrogenase-like Zn-dependent dehydrogenase